MSKRGSPPGNRISRPGRRAGHALLLLLFALAISCQSTSESTENQAPASARGFYFVRTYRGESELIVRNQDAYMGEAPETAYRFAGITELSDSVVQLNRPPERIVCLGVAHVAFLEALGMASRIVGVHGAHLIVSQSVRDSIASGYVRDVAQEGEEPVNYELLRTLRPDLIIGCEQEIGPEILRRIREMGLPVLRLGQCHERHPLGRSEWVRAVGFIVGRLPKADSIFQDLSRRYLELAAQTTGFRKRPDVLVGILNDSLWTLPGQDSPLGHLIRDAGGNLIGPSVYDSQPHELSLSQGMRYAMEAEFWLHPGESRSLHELRALNATLGGLPCVQIRQVYSHTKRKNHLGGNAYWERGTLQPHLILQDLISILHPRRGELTDTLFYYQRLR